MFPGFLHRKRIILTNLLRIIFSSCMKFGRQIFCRNATNHNNYIHYARLFLSIRKKKVRTSGKMGKCSECFVLGFQTNIYFRQMRFFFIGIVLHKSKSIPQCHYFFQVGQNSENNHKNKYNAISFLSVVVIHYISDDINDPMNFLSRKSTTKIKI